MANDTPRSTMTTMTQFIEASTNFQGHHQAPPTNTLPMHRRAASEIPAGYTEPGKSKKMFNRLRGGLRPPSCDLSMVPAEELPPKAVQTLGIPSQDVGARSGLPTDVGPPRRSKSASRGVSVPPKLDRMGMPSVVGRRDGAQLHEQEEPLSGSDPPFSGENFGFNIGGFAGTFSSDQMRTTQGTSTTKKMERPTLYTSEPVSSSHGTSTTLIPPMPFQGDSDDEDTPLLNSKFKFPFRLVDKELPPLPTEEPPATPIVRRKTTPAALQLHEAAHPPPEIQQKYEIVRDHEQDESPLPSSFGQLDVRHTPAKIMRSKHRASSRLAKISDENRFSFVDDPNSSPLKVKEATKGKGKKQGKKETPKAPAAAYTPSDYDLDHHNWETPAEQKTFARPHISASEYKRLATENSSSDILKPRFPSDVFISKDDSQGHSKALNFAPLPSRSKSSGPVLSPGPHNTLLQNMRHPMHKRSQSDQIRDKDSTETMGSSSTDPSLILSHRPMSKDKSGAVRKALESLHPTGVNSEVFSPSALTPFMAQHAQDFYSPSYGDYNNPSAVPSPLNPSQKSTSQYTASPHSHRHLTTTDSFITNPFTSNNSNENMNSSNVPNQVPNGISGDSNHSTPVNGRATPAEIHAYSNGRRQTYDPGQTHAHVRQPYPYGTQFVPRPYLTDGHSVWHTPHLDLITHFDVVNQHMRQNMQATVTAMREIEERLHSHFTQRTGAVMQTVNESVGDIRDSLNAIEHNIGRLCGEMEQMGSRIQTLTETVDESNNQQNSMAESINDALSSINSLGDRLGRVEQRVSQGNSNSHGQLQPTTQATHYFATAPTLTSFNSQPSIGSTNSQSAFNPFSANHRPSQPHMTGGYFSPPYNPAQLYDPNQASSTTATSSRGTNPAANPFANYGIGADNTTNEHASSSHSNEGDDRAMIHGRGYPNVSSNRYNNGN